MRSRRKLRRILGPPKEKTVNFAVISFSALLLFIVSFAIFNFVMGLNFDSAKAAENVDLSVTKYGHSCGLDNICGNSDDNSGEVKPGETINYEISYNNIGPGNAENAVIIYPNISKEILL